MRKYVILAIIMIITGTMLPEMAVATESDNDKEISVTGTGTVSARPDIARVNIGAISQKVDAGSAMNETNEKMAKLSDGLKNIGVPDEKIKTSSITLEPVYSQQPRAPQDSSGSKPVAPEIVAYRATNTVTVEVPVDKAGLVVDTAQLAGLNDIRGITFTFSEERQSELYDEALQEAIKDGAEKAGAIANSSGIGPIILKKVTETQTRPVYARSAYAPGPVMESVAVSPGENEVKAIVTMVYTF